ncbi:MAG: TIGR02281 family clan AA aspartic protease [Aequorivita sp.]
MKERQGVYMVPCKLNGVSLAMLLDTGASDVVISSTEAAFLMKQGSIVEDDIIGKGKYQTADGRIVEGTYLNIRELHIGDILLSNVKAAIIEESNAPLLLGQSALSQLGSYRISDNQLILEDYFSKSPDKASILCEKNGFKSLNFDMKPEDLPASWINSNDKCMVGENQIICIIKDAPKEFKTIFDIETDGLVVYFSKITNTLERIHLLRGYLIKIDPTAGNAIPNPPTSEFDHLYNMFSTVLGKPELVDSENKTGTTIYWNCKDISLIINFKLKDIDVDENINMIAKYTMDINFIKKDLNLSENLINQF